MRWCLTMIVCFLVGCGSCGDDTQPAEPDPDVGVRSERDTPPGPCQGCVDENGECLPGKEDDACGAGGTACTECSGETTCTDDGECVTPPECGAGTCDGCCTADDECLDGTAADACGAGGIRCSDCPEEATCTDGQCVFGCGPDNCNGCCDPAGECQAGDADELCGTAGVACSDCSADGSICSGGACVAMGCAETCAGCCAGDQCLEAVDEDQCGTAGAACVDCADGESCVDGACVAPEGSTWNLVLISADIAPSKPDGAGWDSFGGLPDVYGWAGTIDPATDETWQRESTIIDETLTPVWNEVLLEGVTTAALTEGLAFDLYDRDFAFDDPICITDLVVDASMMNGQVIESTCDDAPDTKWRWRLEVAQ